jgi:hypothetical protein
MISHCVQDGLDTARIIFLLSTGNSLRHANAFPASQRLVPSSPYRLLCFNSVYSTAPLTSSHPSNSLNALKKHVVLPISYYLFSCAPKKGAGK